MTACKRELKLGKPPALAGSSRELQNRGRTEIVPREILLSFLEIFEDNKSASFKGLFRESSNA